MCAPRRLPHGFDEDDVPQKVRCFGCGRGESEGPSGDFQGLSMYVCHPVHWFVYGRSTTRKPGLSKPNRSQIFTGVGCCHPRVQTGAQPGVESSVWHSVRRLLSHDIFSVTTESTPCAIRVPELILGFPRRAFATFGILMKMRYMNPFPTSGFQPAAEFSGPSPKAAQTFVARPHQQRQREPNQFLHTLVGLRGKHSYQTVRGPPLLFDF